MAEKESNKLLVVLVINGCTLFLNYKINAFLPLISPCINKRNRREAYQQYKVQKQPPEVFYKKSCY